MSEKKRPEPIGYNSLDLCITNRCQLECKYCFHFLDKGVCKTATMSDEVLEACVEFLMKNRRKKPDKSFGFTLYGGEPTMVPERIEKVVTLLEGRLEEAFTDEKTRPKVKASGPSNYVHFSRELIELMERRPNVTWSLSCDGPRAQGIQRTFPDGTSSWPNVLKNMEWMAEFRKRHKKKSHLNARMTVTPASVEVFAADVREMWELGFNRVSPQIAFEMSGWTRTKLNTLARQRELVADLVIETYKRGKPLHARFLEQVFDRVAKPMLRRSQWICGAGRGMLGVSVEGELWPCHRFVGNDKDDPKWKPFYLGNVLKDDYDPDSQIPWIEIDMVRDCPKDCASCSSVAYCNPCCYYMNVQCTGNVCEPSDAWCDDKRHIDQLAWYVNHNLQRAKCKGWNKWLSERIKRGGKKKRAQQKEQNAAQKEGRSCGCVETALVSECQHDCTCPKPVA